MALNWQGVWTVISGLEFWGTLTGVWAVYLTARERMLNWPIGLINIGIFIALFVQAKLYSDVLLNVAFFLPLQILGWIWWARSRRGLGLAEPPKPTRRPDRTAGCDPARCCRRPGSRLVHGQLHGRLSALRRCHDHGLQHRRPVFLEPAGAGALVLLDCL